MSNRGFTLLEVLIAVSLLSIMMLLLAGSLRIAAGTWDIGESQADRTSQMIVVQNFLRKSLSGAVPWRVTPSDGRAYFLFRGDRVALEYVGTLSPYIRAGVHRFRLFVSGSGARKSLKLAIRPLEDKPTRDHGAPIEDVTLLEDLDWVEFSYLPPTEENRMEWLPEWGEDGFPVAVMLRLRQHGQEAWPPIIVMPRSEAAG